MPDAEKHYRILVIDDDGRNHEVFEGAMQKPVDDGQLRKLEYELFGNESGEDRASEEEPMTFEIECAFQGREGHEMVRKAIEETGTSPYAAVFVDMRMPPGWDGMMTMENLWALDDGLQLVMCSAYADYSPGQVARRLGCSGRFYTLQKPFQLSDLRELMRDLAEKWEASRAETSASH